SSSTSSCGTWSNGSARAMRGADRSRLVVLVYHAIADLADDPILARYSVPPDRFAEHLDYLSERGWSFVDLDQVLAAFDGGPPLPPRTVLLTFDDAYADLLHAACPVLSSRGIPAVAFAVAGQIGGSNVWDSRNGATSLDLLDGKGLREVSGQGIEIGAHTATHRALTEVPAEELKGELDDAARLLEQAGIPRPRAFSYPYGHWNARVAAAVAEAGYEVAFTVDRGVAQNGADLYALPRMAVHVDDTGRKLHMKLSAARLPGPVQGALRSLRGLRRRA
ncbi:MAG TPA: polysaccharide deacetylase family protein, partial [Solirubrobacterales bacterium]